MQTYKECELTGIKTWVYKLGQESLKDIIVYFARAFYSLFFFLQPAFENPELLNIWDILLKEYTSPF